MKPSLVVIRGGGDLATGVAQKFFRSGFSVIILETAAPSAIRRTVCLCEAAYAGEAAVEGMACKKAAGVKEALDTAGQGEIIPLLVDPAGSSISALRPAAVIDAIMAKKNTGTNRGMAAVTIALGPGFTAGVDVDIVIETMRGHDLGRLVLKGAAQADTGIPAEVGGRGSQRVIYTRAAGTLRHLKKIGDRVQEGEPLFSVEGDLYTAPFAGVLRGLLREGAAAKGAKAADVDPRLDTDVFSISDKARSVGGAALEAYFFQTRKNGGVV